MGEGAQARSPPAPATATPQPVQGPAHGPKEFGGPLGTSAIVIFLPLVVYALWFVCNGDVCVTNPLDASEWRAVLASLPSTLWELSSPRAWATVLGWLALQVFLDRALPGEVVEGVELRGGGRLKYCLNGHLAFWLSLVLMGHGRPVLNEDWSIHSLRPMALSLLYDDYVQLISAAVAVSWVLSICLYAASFRPGAKLAEGGNTGNPAYDFFLGRELNPRILGLDLKCHCELRPGLIGWAVLNLGMAAKQYSRLGRVTASMALLNAFQGLYVWDALHSERAILTTMDITTDGFGFMLAFGDLAWVPFIYSLQARYLVDHDPGLSPLQLLAVTALHFLGYYVFRAANSQKDAFRRNPDAPEVAHLTFLQTKRGTKLITSGWWGAARKINYTGDWLTTLSWCMLCGGGSVWPYFQAVYFLVLLVHRAIRDDGLCRAKYGEDWAEYKRRVPYVFIPYVI